MQEAGFEIIPNYNTAMSFLFITSNPLGDAILSTGALKAFLEEGEYGPVTIACGPTAAPIFEGVPGLETIIPMQKGRYLAHWRRLLGQTMGKKWDLVVDLRGSATAYVLRAKRRVVARKDGGDDHQLVQLGGALGMAAPPEPHIYIRDEDYDEAARLIPDGPPVIAVGPTAKWQGKAWPIERYVSLVERLSGPNGPLPGARIVVSAASHEREFTRKLLEAVPDDRLINLARGEHLLTVAACFKRADLYIGNDSGLMHLAAAVGTKTLGLFGPTRENLYYPWGAQNGYVRTNESFEVLCPPGLPLHPTKCLMTGLSVEKVEASVRQLFEENSSRI